MSQSEDDDLIESQAARIRVLEQRIDVLRQTLADIALSKDMTLTLARAKALRTYRETQP